MLIRGTTMCCVLLIGPVAVWMTTGGARAADWPQWGGRNSRNMVSEETGLPDSFEPGKKMPSGRGIDPATTKNVKWTARLGSAAYGNPTVARGKVFLGTDDLTVSEDPRFTRSKGGLVKCLDEATGELVWQLVCPKRSNIPKEMHFSHQHLGVCSSPTVDGGRVYVVSSAGDVLCLDVDGQADGNDGPYADEGQYLASHGKKPVDLSERDGDILWRFDPIEELGVFVHDAASCSVLVHGDVVYLSTSNGVNEAHDAVIAPEAPAMIALDKRTGRLVARENEGISARLFHCQWSSPSLAEVDGKALVLFGGGDGVCYAFEALADVPKEPADLKLVWSYDCNPPEYKYRDGKPIPYYEGDKRKRYSTNENDGKYVGPSQIIATPVFHAGQVYVAIGQDPAHGRGKGLLHCIDATQTGDVTATGKIWSYDGLDRSMATVTIADGLVYASDVAGRLHCLDADTGQVYCVHDLGAETWGGALVADGKLYIGNKRQFFILAAGREPKVLSQLRLGSPAYSTPIAANGVVYVASQRYLWAVAQEQIGN